MNAGHAIPRPLRLLPGDDLRARIEQLAREQGIAAAFVVCGIGSLSRTAIRLAGAAQAEVHEGDVEIVSLAGSVSPDGAHLHAALADASGRVFGGHVAHGCTVRTTAEVLILELPGWTFSRRHDGTTGYPELVIEPRT
jgi:predicted DNA-binding protein with PD1-like motif